MDEFVYNVQASRVVFGAGALKHLEREVDLMGARRALVLSTPEQHGQAQRVADRWAAALRACFPERSCTCRSRPHVLPGTRRAA